MARPSFNFKRPCSKCGELWRPVANGSVNGYPRRMKQAKICPACRWVRHYIFKALGTTIKWGEKMAYIRSKVINGHTYYYLQKSMRVNGKVITKHVKYLGKKPPGKELGTTVRKRGVMPNFQGAKGGEIHGRKTGE